MKKILLILLFFAAFPALAQDNAPEGKMKLQNPEGTEFFLTFMRNFNEPDPNNENPNDRLILELFITSDKTAKVNIDIESIGFHHKMVVPAGEVKNVSIDRKAQILSNEIIEREAAVHVTSDVPVTIYGLNRRKQTTDTYLGLPVEALGTEYRVICYNVSEKLMPQFAIVATEDTTRVTIIPRVETEAGRLPGQPFDIWLDKGDVYQVTAKYKPLSVLKNDLTGSLVIANKKVSVFSGHQCAYVPDRIIACNHLVEQVPPTPSWGKHFFIGKLKKRSKYTYRVLSNQNQTRIFKDARLIATLNEGEFLEEVATEAINITADRPVLVAQYSQGYRNGDSIGDPMMLLISPTQQFLKKYRFATPVNGYWEHYINVVAPTKSIRSLRLNGRPLEAGIFEPLGISRYSIAYIKVDFGTHVLEGSEPFGMYSYGFGYDKNPFDAYGTIGGQSFMDYEAAEDTIPPVAEVRSEQSQFMELIFRDDQVDDTGLKSVYPFDDGGLSASIPPITGGSPQAVIRVSAPTAGKDAYIKLKAVDMADNVSDYTVCYYFDKMYKKYIFSLNKGIDVSCATEADYFIGVFGKLNYVRNSADFSSTGDFSFPGTFNGISGLGGYGGLYFSKYLTGSWTAAVKLSFENHPGRVEAPDTLGIERFNPATGRYEPFQEAATIRLNSLFINLSLGAEYYLTNNLYLTGGLILSINPSGGADIRRRILTPESASYEQGALVREIEMAPDELESLRTFRLGMFGGAGFSILINRKIALFTELNATPIISGMLSDADWNMISFSWMAGVKYRL